MLELNLTSDRYSSASMPANLAYGGDTLNTSIYLSRLGVKVDYVTALGDDAMSGWMLGQWQSEGVGCSLVQRDADSVPGLYMIEVDEQGERTFHYWRKNSPASQLFDSDCDELFKALMQYSYIYLSGISIAILKPESRARLTDFLTGYRALGGKVIFDGNYRPNLWRSPQEAMRCYQQLYSITDIALPTFEDEQALFGYQTANKALEAILLSGVPEVVLKMGEQGCLYSSHGEVGFVPTRPVDVVDTTSAGDSFNAGFLAMRLYAKDVAQSCAAGHLLASVVIQHRGAVVARELMPTDLTTDVTKVCDAELTRALNYGS